MLNQAINIATIKQNNLRSVLIAIHKYGPISKRELQEKTSLSWGSISTMVKELQRLNYVVSTGKIEGNVGRQAIEYSINTNYNYIIGIDLNTSGITIVATDLFGKILRQAYRPIGLLTHDKVLEALFSVTDNMINECYKKNILGIGIAVQGIINTKKGISIFFPQISGWSNVRLAELFEDRYNIKAFLMHDPDCIMVAEMAVGSLRAIKHSNTALVRLDKGIGLSLSIDDIINTKNYVSELGHICVNYNGPKCVCGNNGCLENYASVDGILRRYYELSKTPYNPDITFKAIALMAMEGNEICVELFRDMSKYLGTSFSMLANILPIDNIILYGSMIRVKELFDEQMNEYMNKHLYGDKNIKIIYSSLDINAPALGAAIWVSDIVISNTIF